MQIRHDGRLRCHEGVSQLLQRLDLLQRGQPVGKLHVGIRQIGHAIGIALTSGRGLWRKDIVHVCSMRYELLKLVCRRWTHSILQRTHSQFSGKQAKGSGLFPIENLAKP